MITRLDNTFKKQIALIQDSASEIENLNTNLQKTCWALNTLYELHQQTQKQLNELIRQALTTKETN